MNPEQLEAHRVRFEQRFYGVYGFEPNWVIGAYSEQAVQASWEGYQWAIQDAALQHITEFGELQDAQQLHPDVVNAAIVFQQAKQIEALTARLQQPVATASVYEYCQDDKGEVAGKCWNTANVTWAAGFLASLQEGSKIDLYTAAQPVEVQRVPLTPARKNAMRVEYVTAQPADAARAYYSFIAGIEWGEREHGIQPTGEKGGASCSE